MTDSATFDTYEQMFDAYLAGRGTVPADAAPLVFHARRICRQLDRQATANGGETVSAKDSSYLRAIDALHSRLNPRRTKSDGPEQIVGQVDIFDAMDDEGS
jgi:hypothetical protein